VPYDLLKSEHLTAGHLKQIVSEKRIKHRLQSGLSDREVHLIGKIIVEWGAIEYEVFNQTLLTFDGVDDEQTALPSAMNNLQLTKLLDLWKERVVEKSQGERSLVLQLQLDEILGLKPFRDAIVHGVWTWSPSNLAAISTVRVRKKQILTTKFTVDDLEDFDSRLASINFKIRYPGGLEDLASERAESGVYFSREFLNMMHGSKEPDA